MVRLDRIYTRTGDTGQTSLGDGSRVDKTSPRLAAMGAVDEVNCHLGLAVCAIESDSLRAVLNQVQQLLFDVGADLCTPLPPSTAADSCPRISDTHTSWLEKHIDVASGQLEPLNSFILPGGRPAAASLHLARAVCRRAELECRTLLQVSEPATVNGEVAVFLNRLSDLLFVLARQANDNGTSDVLWKPGSTVSEADS